MKINNITKQNFCGYNNVLALGSVPVGSLTISSFSTQLNDKDDLKPLYEGEKMNHLTEYRKLRRMQGAAENDVNDDILTLTFVSNSKHKNNLFIGLDDYSLYWGSELRVLRDRYVPKLLTEEEYIKTEAIHLKAYTLLANITKHMMNDNRKMVEDINKYRIYDNFEEALAKHIGDKSIARQLTALAKSKYYHFQEVALPFNLGISKTMHTFFK